MLIFYFTENLRNSLAVFNNSTGTYFKPTASKAWLALLIVCKSSNLALVVRGASP